MEAIIITINLLSRAPGLEGKYFIFLAYFTLCTFIVFILKP